MASFAISPLDSSAVTPPRHAASARRARLRSPARSASWISVNTWLKRRKPISRYSAAMFQARPSSGCSAASATNTPAAISTGGSNATSVAIIPCCAMPPFSRRSTARA